MRCTFSFCSNNVNNVTPQFQRSGVVVDTFECFVLNSLSRIVRKERQSNSPRFAAQPFPTKSTLLTRPRSQQNFKVTPPNKRGVQSPLKSSNNQRANNPVLLLLDQTPFIFMTAELIRQRVFIRSKSILHIWSIDWHHTLEDVAQKRSV